MKLEKEDSPELLAWLQKIEPLVHKQLSQAARSHAFDGDFTHLFLIPFGQRGYVGTGV